MKFLSLLLFTLLSLNCLKAQSVITEPTPEINVVNYDIYVGQKYKYRQAIDLMKDNLEASKRIKTAFLCKVSGDVALCAGAFLIGYGVGTGFDYTHDNYATYNPSWALLGTGMALVLSYIPINFIAKVQTRKAFEAFAMGKPTTEVQKHQYQIQPAQEGIGLSVTF